jgi:hypothetical protein
VIQSNWKPIPFNAFEADELLAPVLALELEPALFELELQAASSDAAATPPKRLAPPARKRRRDRPASDSGAGRERSSGTVGSWVMGNA